MSYSGSQENFYEEVGEAPSTYSSKFHALQFDEASQCLKLLGKESSGLRYAYLLMSAKNRYLTDISIITEFKHILFVNVSGNRLVSQNLKCLTELPFLLSIQCDQNLIDDPNFGTLKYLQVLTLKDNMISTPTGICHPLLECLELSNNQIVDITELNPTDVPNLRVLDVKSNAISTLHPLYFTRLDSLYLADNKIKVIVDLSGCPNLRILHLRKNRLTRIRGFASTMKKLEYINVRENNIKKVQRFQKLRCLPNLKTLTCIDNPCMPQENVEEEETDYGGESHYSIRVQILRILPNLIRLNKKTVTDDERDILKEIIDEQGEYLEEEESPEGSSYQESITDVEEEISNLEFNDDESNEIYSSEYGDGQSK